MKKTTILLLSFLVCLVSTISVSAQTYYEDDYKYLYDYDHRVVVRKCIPCTYDRQDLWNGDHVRIINNTIYIYEGNSRVVYGDKVWLEHTGYYTVQRGSTMYLYDPHGNYTSVYGNMINALWDGIYCVQRGSYWYLYTKNGNRWGSIYSTEEIALYWNGCYLYRTNDGYYRVADPDGDAIPNNYSQEEPTLTNAGYFQYLRNGNYYVFDTNGNRMY